MNPYYIIRRCIKNKPYGEKIRFFTKIKARLSLHGRDCLLEEDEVETMQALLEYRKSGRYVNKSALMQRFNEDNIQLKGRLGRIRRAFFSLWTAHNIIISEGERLRLDFEFVLIDDEYTRKKRQQQKRRQIIFKVAWTASAILLTYGFSVALMAIFF